MRRSILCLLPLMLSGGGHAALTLNFDFETDQSAQFIVRDGAGDFSVNFNYDYSTWSPQSGTTGPTSIPPGPSGSGTKGLRLEVNNNDSAAALDAVTVFPVDAAGLSSYILKFDMWQQYWGQPAGVGTTEMIFAGGHSDATEAAWPSATAFTGFFFGMSSDGDASADYRYYESAAAAPVAEFAKPNWNGADEREATSPGWQAIFPSPTYEVAGATGKAWTTVELVVSGSSATAYVTPTGGIRTQVGSWTIGNALNSGYPLVGYYDVSSSIATQPADQFAIIDNLSIIQVTAATDWTLYE